MNASPANHRQPRVAVRDASAARNRERDARAAATAIRRRGQAGGQPSGGLPEEASGGALSNQERAIVITALGALREEIEAMAATLLDRVIAIAADLDQSSCAASRSSGARLAPSVSIARPARLRPESSLSAGPRSDPSEQ